MLFIGRGKRIIERINDISQQMELQKQEFISQIELQKQEIATIKQILEHLKDKIDNADVPDRVYWKNEFEKNFVINTWGNGATIDTDIVEKYKKLVEGLDQKSIETVDRILYKHRRYMSTDDKWVDLYTREEQDQIRHLKEDFYDEIIQLSENVFAYRNYYLPINHFESSVFYTKHGLSELNNAVSVEGKTILDVGGFIGDSVLILEELKPKQIISFEASINNVALMKKTIELNSLDNVTIECVALGSENGTIELIEDGSCSTVMNLKNEGSSVVKVPMITLDDYVRKNNITDIGLIKVDIEGAETSFLKGAKNTIVEQKPILLLSIYHTAHDFFYLKPMIEEWNLGYSFKIYKPVIENVTGETLLIAEPKQEN